MDFRDDSIDDIVSLNHRNQLILNAAGEGIFGLNSRGHITFANPAAARMLGWSVEEMLQQPKSQHDLIHYSHADGTPYIKDHCPIYAALRDGQVHRRDDEVFWGKNGSSFPVAYTSTPIRDEHGIITGSVVIFQDITERKENEKRLQEAYENLEEKVEARTLELKKLHQQVMQELSERKRLEAQLIQSQKMESIGQLAAGVAHEINNPLGFTISNLSTLCEYVSVFKKLLEHYCRLAATEFQTPAEKQEFLSLAEAICSKAELDYILRDIDALLLESNDGLKRVQDIVQGLKSFSRVDETETQDADINDCIEATLKVIWNELKYKCEVHKYYGNIPVISCQPGKLNQVFMNLLLNAAQAIPEKGDIFIKTFADQEKITVIFQDTGAGIPKDILSRIFDPFFTTKPVGVGTGLGLSVSYGIIRKQGGDIQVETEVGKGTVFTITIPIV